MPDFDLVVVGEINPDLILRGPDLAPAFGQEEKLVETATLTIGASSAIMACGASRLGLRTAFVGVVGDDELGHFMLRALNERGVDVSACIVDERSHTGMSVILSQPEDRAILTYLGSIATLRAEWIDRSMLQRARHLHVGSYFLLDALRPDLPALYAEAHALGLTTSLDTNWDPSGAIARRGWKTARVSAYTVHVVDTTGAGDSFDAGFLFGYLNGWSLQRATQLACACGALSTRAAGGTGGQPTLDEALQLLNHG
jgi:sugar/nucleoside kinase (ribokinase family)